jgi:Tol biopolymer transport system component
MLEFRIGAGLSLVLAAIMAAPVQATPPGRNGLITWQRESTGPPRLWVANPDGSGARQVFKGTERQAEFEATFSPANPDVMFFSRGAWPFRPFVEELYRGDLRTGQVVRLPGGANRADIAPAVSPDGTRLAWFIVPRAPLDEDSPPPSERIQVAGIDGSGSRSITARKGHAIDPDWSPDGTRLVYTQARIRGERVQNRLVVVNADGTGRRALTAFGGRDEINPKWMPDGQTIVFEHLREGGQRSRIVAMPAAGGAPRVIYDSPGWDTNPIPSPDGARIAFTSDRHAPRRERLNGSFELYTMAVDGSDVVRLTSNRSFDLFPDWQRLP